MFRHKFSGSVSVLAKSAHLKRVLHPRWAFALFDPEIAALFLPIFRESFTQFGKRYGFGFTSIKNQIDDIRGQIANKALDLS